MSDKGTEANPHIVLSYGGGVQSNALLVLAAQGKVHFDAIWFANVGADSESKKTLRYIEEVAKPYAERMGLPFNEVQVTKRNGEKDTLLQAIERRQGSVVIPALVEGSGVSNRTCTVDFKIRLINRHIKRTTPGAYVRMGIGFSTDEWTRARDTNWHDRYGSEESKNPEKLGFYRQNYYPLLEMGISRNQCHAIITSAGLPTPPKSSCKYCPYHRRGEWVQMKQYEPEEFEVACHVDDLLRDRNIRLQGKPVFLHPDRKPLREAVPDQMMMFEQEDELDCKVGHCMT